MNDEKNRFESGTLKSKLKELLSITLFTLITAFMALFLADLIFFPITCFSIRNVDYFNIIFKYTVFFCVSAFMLISLYFKIKSLYIDGNKTVIRFITGFMILFIIDLIIYPAAYYSGKNFANYSTILKYTTIFFVTASIFILVFLKLRLLYTEGKTVKSLILYVILRPLQYLGFFVLTILIISLLIAVIYFLFNSNYYHLHRIAGGA